MLIKYNTDIIVTSFNPAVVQLVLPNFN